MKDQHKANKVRIIFMGTSNFAGVILRYLISSPYKIAAVFTQPEKKTGRQGQYKSSEVKKIAQVNKLKVFEPDKFNQVSVKILKDQKPDLIVLADYGKILPKEVLDIPRLGALNVHASLLPKFRGPSPVQNAILQGEKETGVTIIIMNEKVDAGNILSQKKVKIDPDETYPQLLLKLADLGGSLLIKTVHLWMTERIKPRRQDESKITLCQLIEKGDGKVIWNNEAKLIYNQFRAFISWPGLFTYWENKGKNLRIKLNKISWSGTNSSEYHIGEVFETERIVEVKTGSGIITLEEVQIEGKASTKIENFINGYPNFIGSVLE